MPITFYVPNAIFVPSGSPAHWYDAGQILGLSDNDPVVTWPDLVVADDLTQSTPADRPVYKATGGGGKSLPYVAGDPTTQKVLTVPYSVALTHPVTIFVVSAPITIGNSEFMIASHTNRGCELSQNGNWVTYSGNAVDWSAATGWVNGVWSIFTLTCNGASSTLRVNGVALSAPQDIGAVGMDGLTLGAAVANKWPNIASDIAWGEIIVYDGVESPAANEGGLASKWGL